MHWEVDQVIEQGVEQNPALQASKNVTHYTFT
jgi:hypothetical protein